MDTDGRGNMYGNFSGTDVAYEEPIPKTTVSKPSPQSSSKNDGFPFRWLYVWRAVLTIILCTLLGLSVFTVVGFQSKNQAPLAGGDTANNPAASCTALKDAGRTQSGYYFIQPPNTQDAFQVFCNMDSNGGGWTLVATINENDLKQTCSQEDNWFTYAPGAVSTQQGNGRSNWENAFVFGSARSAVSKDYKSPAYHLMSADDVMVQHVSSIVDVNTDDATPFLRYHTKDKFLTKYGGNLYELYTKHYPLKPKSAPHFNHKSLLDTIAKSASDISSLIPNFYKYEYPAANTGYLSSGGRNMFTHTGMRLYVPFCYSYPTFDKVYRCETRNSVISSRTTYPFFEMLFVGNFDELNYGVMMRVQSYRPNTDNTTQYSSTMTEGDFEMIYIAECRDSFNNATPNLCDVFFLLKNEKQWATPLDAGIEISSLVYSNYYYRHANQRGTWRNTILGYTMFASTNDGFISETSVKRAMEKLLAIVAGVDNIAPHCLENNGPAVPVTITKGADVFNSTVPPRVPGITTGFLQFRTYGKSGAAFALCPGIKIDRPTCVSEYVCMGGVTNSTNQQSCNDFANWSGKSSDTLLPTQGNGFAHSIRDIHSTIMIFYR